jgi:DNA polymerase III epsilon subunit family exonuclease
VSFALGPPLRRVLDRLDAADATLSVPELAQRLLSLTAPLESALARRILATALGCGAERLPDRVSVRELPRIVEGPSAARPLASAEWIVVDLETTGVSSEQSTILEIGAVRIRGLRSVETFHTLVDPGMAIPPFITRLTGIDRSMVDGAPPLGSAIAAFHAWVGAAEGTAFVAHNASFDHRFVAIAFERHGLAPWPGPVLCTRRLARRILPDLGRYDLDTLSARFGIANRWRHRALGDAEATAQALLALLAIAQEAHAVAELGDLVQLQSARLARKRRTRAATPAPVR